MLIPIAERMGVVSTLFMCPPDVGRNWFEQNNSYTDRLRCNSFAKRNQPLKFQKWLQLKYENLCFWNSQHSSYLQVFLVSETCVIYFFRCKDLWLKVCSVGLCMLAYPFQFQLNRYEQTNWINGLLFSGVWLNGVFHKSAKMTLC